MKYCFLVLFALVVGITNGYSKQTRPEIWGQPVILHGISNMYKIDEGVYRCDQPDEEGFVALQKFGIKEVLNLRYWHSDDDEAKGTSLTLYRIKMAAHNINTKDIVDALRTIKNRKGSIVFHCQHGSDRTGVVCAMYRIVIQGWDREKAIDEMKNGGYGFHGIYINIPKYIRNVDVDSIKKELQ